MLNGRKALITGAQQGIGAATSVAMARAGADLVVNYLDDREAAEGVANAAQAFGVTAELVHGDISTAAGAGALVAESVRRLGSVDILVNNAGIFPATPPLEIEEEEWDRVLGVNLKGTFFCAQAAAKAMIAAGIPGSIINLSSIVVMGPGVGPHYVASKGAVVTLTRSLANSLAEHRIRVNAVAPGLIDTAQPRGHMSQQQLDDTANFAIPWRRIGHPDDVAGLITFLAGPDADYITGQTIHINGGQLMR